MIKVISGGQTGVDQMGLEVARFLGLETGGTAPRGYRTEVGPQPELLKGYGLTESPSSNYKDRTRDNVANADGTVLFGEMSAGTQLTRDICVALNKPHLINPGAEELYQWIKDHSIQVLNVAGNRASKISPIGLKQARGILQLAFFLSKESKPGLKIIQLNDHRYFFRKGRSLHDSSTQS